MNTTQEFFTSFLQRVGSGDAGTLAGLFSEDIGWSRDDDLQAVSGR
jgi:hypothetical protein